MNKRIILITIFIFMIFNQLTLTQDDFNIEDVNDNYDQNNQNYNQGNQQYMDQNQQRQIQYYSQRRTACLVLSRYYLNEFTEDIQSIIKDLAGQDQQKYINKLYTTAVEKCQPTIQQNQVFQFFTPNDNFNPKQMYYIFDGFNFNQLSQDFNSLTSNQQNILKFIKNFDDQMQIKKQQKQSQKNQDQRQQGIQLFFIPVKNLSSQVKYIYIIIVLLVSGSLLYWGFNQIGQKPQKKTNKRRKKQ